MDKRSQIESAIKTMVAAINSHDLEACVSVYSQDALLQDPRFPEPVRGIQYVKEGFKYFLDAFPDIRVEIDDLIIDEPRVAVEWTFDATHTGDYLGVHGLGGHFKILSAAHFRVEDGKVTRDFSLFDASALRMLEELAGSAQKPTSGDDR